MNLSKASSKFAKTIVKLAIYTIFVIVLVFIGFKAFDYGQKVFYSGGYSEEPGSEVLITIPENASAKEVGKILESYAVIEDGFIFRLQVMIYELKVIVPGEYTFNTSYNSEKIISMLREGPAVIEEDDNDSK